MRCRRRRCSRRCRRSPCRARDRRGRPSARDLRPEQVRGGTQGATLAGVPPPVRRPDADRAAGRRRRLPVPARPVCDGDRAHPADALQRAHGREPGRQGRGERRGPPEDDGRPGQGPARRRGRPGPDGGARSRRHREHRGRRPRARGRSDHPGSDARDRRIGPDRARARRCPSRSRPSQRTRPSATVSTWRS